MQTQFWADRRSPGVDSDAASQLSQGGVSAAAAAWCMQGEMP